MATDKKTIEDHLAAFRAERAEREQAEADRQAAIKAQGQAILAQQKAEKAAQRAEIERQQAAQIEAELGPVREQERRRWLADHPGTTDADFRKVWAEHLRPYHVQERQNRQAAAGARVAAAHVRNSF